MGGPRRSIGTASAALIAAGAIAGCATARPAARPAPAGAGAGAVALVRAAAQRTLSSSAHVDVVLEGAAIFGPHAPRRVRGTGNFIFTAGAGRLKLDLGEGRAAEPGDEQIAYRPGRVFLQPRAGGLTVIPRGKTWLSATLTGADTVATNFPEFAAQALGVAPALPLAELAGATTAAQPAAPDPAARAATQTATYRATVDPATALSALHGPDAQLLASALRSRLGAAAAPDTIEVSIRAGRVTRLRVGAPGSGAGAVTTTFCCYGKRLQIADPPASQTLDLATLTPSGERENNGGGDSDGG